MSHKTEIGIPERELSKRTDMVQIHNPLKYDFKHPIGGETYGIKAGQTTAFDFPRARFLAERLVDRIIMDKHLAEAKKLRDKGEKVTGFPKKLRDQRLRQKYFTEVFIDKAVEGSIGYEEEDDANVNFGTEVKQEETEKKPGRPKKK